MCLVLLFHAWVLPPLEGFWRAGFKENRGLGLTAKEISVRHFWRMWFWIEIFALDSESVSGFSASND
jgi:hypothetical protein